MSFSDQYVTKVYNEIATHFNDTRAYTWKGVETFINSLSSYSNLLEIGCGNGKNLQIREDLVAVAIDISSSMAKISYQKGLNTGIASCCNLPFRDNYFQATISVAVIHHLDSMQGRLDALAEQIRVTKPGGVIFLQVWARDTLNNMSLEKRQKKFQALETDGDYLVKWQKLNGTVYHRYYHLFSKEEFMELINAYRGKIDPVSIDYEHDNWIAVLKKKNM